MQVFSNYTAIANAQNTKFSAKIYAKGTTYLDAANYQDNSPYPALAAEIKTKLQAAAKKWEKGDFPVVWLTPAQGGLGILANLYKEQSRLGRDASKQAVLYLPGGTDVLSHVYSNAVFSPTVDDFVLTIDGWMPKAKTAAPKAGPKLKDKTGADPKSNPASGGSELAPTRKKV